ncbi:RteC protein [compost metagenome]
MHLVELAYALFETGQINNGGVDISVIAKALESFFNVKLGLIYHPFQEIRLRKRESRTRYLDMMKEGLLRRMDELDS